MTDQKRQFRIEHNGRFTRVFDPDGHEIFAKSVEFRHVGGSRPEVVITLTDVRLDVVINEEQVSGVIHLSRPMVRTTDGADGINKNL